MSSVRIIKPVAITDAMLISTSVPEADYAEWAAATSYTVGQRVIRTATGVHKIYENAVAGINATLPELATTGTTPRWLEVQPTNRWACLDNSITTRTTQSGSISYTLMPSQVVNGITLQNVDADSVRVRMIDPAAGTVYDKTTTLGRKPVSGWHPWYYSRRPVSSAVTLTDLPSYYGASIVVDVVKTGGTAAVGMLLMGYPYTIGLGVEYSASVGIKSYSTDTTDVWGNTYLVKRNFAKKASLPILLPNEELDATFDLLASLSGTACLYIGSDTYACMQVFGWFTDFDIVIPYPNVSRCALSIKGLT